VSAFLVSRGTIDVLALAAEAYRGTSQQFAFSTAEGTTCHRYPGEVGQILWDWNRASVASYYGDDLEQQDKLHYSMAPASGPVDILTGRGTLPRPSALRVLRSLDCLQYQCVDLGDASWEAQAILDALRAEAILDLPGFGELSWDVWEAEEVTS